MTDGRTLFEGAGCATCHRAHLGDVEGIYSDLLLHDMGPALSDSGSYYGLSDPSSPKNGVKTQEWRTPPLWGFRDSGPYLHDGRARDLEQAVAFHDGQARNSARRFFKLVPAERLLVQAFLRSLRPPSAAGGCRGRLSLSSTGSPQAAKALATRRETTLSERFPLTPDPSPRWGEEDREWENACLGLSPAGEAAPQCAARVCHGRHGILDRANARRRFELDRERLELGSEFCATSFSCGDLGVEHRRVERCTGRPRVAVRRCSLSISSYLSCICWSLACRSAARSLASTLLTSFT